MILIELSCSSYGGGSLLDKNKYWRVVSAHVAHTQRVVHIVSSHRGLWFAHKVHHVNWDCKHGWNRHHIWIEGLEATNVGHKRILLVF